MRRLALGLLLALAPPHAHAQEVGGRLTVGGGWDSNPALAADAGNRRVPSAGGGSPMRAGVDGDGVFDVTGRAAGWIGDTLGVAAALDVDAQVYGSGDAIAFERLALEGELRLDPVRAACGAVGSRLDSGFGDEDAWTLGGRCRVDVGLGDLVRVGAHGEVSARVFDVGQVDVIGGGGVWGRLTVSPVRVELGLDVVRRGSDERRAERTDLAPWAAVSVDTRWVGGALSYRLTAREFDQGSQDGLEHLGQLSAWARPLPWIGPYVAVEVGVAHGASQALEYERVQITGGVRVAGGWVAPPADDGPTRVDDGVVRFRFHLPGAREVAVVGEHNDWEPERGRLVETADGVFEGEVRLAPGRYAYALIVDGDARPPPGESRLVDDGFGGRNGVIVVP